MCPALRIRDIGICTQNSIKRGNNRQTTAAANGCPQSQNCVQLPVGLQCGVQWSGEVRQEGKEREGYCRPQGRSRTVSYLCGCWKNILAVHSVHSTRHVWGYVCETLQRETGREGGRERERQIYREKGTESALIERRLLSPAREFSFKFSTLDCGFHF